jgi:AcrR family transcriptional regulator
MFQKRTQRSETAQEHLAKTMLRLIVEHGLDNVTSSDVVKAAGITRAAMVRYCPTEDDLWRLTAEFIGQRMIEAWQPVLASRQSPAEQLRALLAIQFGLIMRLPALQGVLHGQSLRGANPAFMEGIIALRAHFRALLCSLIRDAIRAGQFPRNLDPEGAAQRIIDALQGRVVSWSLDEAQGDSGEGAWAPLDELLRCILLESGSSAIRPFGNADPEEGSVSYGCKKSR